MKIQPWLLAIFILLTMGLAGCGLALEAEEEHLEPIDLAAWPTPQPTIPAISPTTFPQAQLAATATPTLPAPPALASSAQSEGKAGDNGVEAAIPVSGSLGNLSPAATAFVTVDNAPVYREPGTSAVGAVERGQLVGVLGRNPEGDWLYVLTTSQVQGWLSREALRVTGTLDQAPVLPPDHRLVGENNAVSNEIPANNPVPQAEPASFNSTSPAQETTIPAWGSLGPVATARIARNEVYIHPGPSSDFAAINKITDNQEQLTLLALDPSKKWALVQPAASKIGWVTLDDLTVEGSVAAAPQIYTAWVVSNAVEVRSGPGIFHERVGQAAIDSLVQVLGLDDSHSWVLIQPIPGGHWGWSPVQFLKNVGQPWANLPVVEDNKASGGHQAEDELSPPDTQSLTPNPQPHLVFQRSSGGDIMVINPDGSGLRRLTGGIDPVLSPDGQTIAFTRWEGESGSLWLINLDGSNERQALGFIKQAKGPEWSPDGSQVVLNFQHGGRLESKSECFDVEKAPNPPRNAEDIKGRLDPDSGAQVCWKLPPDPHWSLRVVNLADGHFEDVDGGTYAFRPAWDPSQPWRIVSDGGRGLLATDLNRDYRQNLTEEVNDGSPVFSPDGQYLALTSGKEGGSAGYDVYRLNADGSGRVRLTQTPLWVPVQPDTPTAWNNVAPAWSPDGSQLAFLTDRTGRWEIWVMNVDGSNQRPMFSDEVNQQLQLSYNFVDERVLSWR